MLKHAPVVRYLATIGQIDGGATSRLGDAPTIPLRPSWQRDHLAVVAFVQEVRGPRDPRLRLGPASDAPPVNEYPYWLDTLPSAGSQTVRSWERQKSAAAAVPADVVIVGAGYTGLAAARQLARAGASVVVDRAEQVGWGASSRNGGQVLTGMKVEAATLVARFGRARARASCSTSPPSRSSGSKR